MKVFIYITAVFLSLSSFSQGRINISGTRLTIVPPFEEFIFSTYFPVIGEDYHYEISAMEIPPSEYPIFSSQIDSVTYAKEGYTVVKQSKIIIDGFPMKIVRLRGGNTESYRILYGDSTFSAIITIPFFTNKEPDLGEKLMNSVKSIKVDRINKIDWSKHLVIVPPTDTKFKLVEGSFYGRLLFTIEGKQTVNLWDESSIIVKQISRPENMSNEKIVAQFTPDLLLSEEGLELKKVIYDGNSMVDGKEVHQFIADCTIQGGKSIRFNVIGYLGGEYALFLQTTSTNENDTPEIERFIKEMKLK
jgi:hypothetical protein